VTDGMAIAAAHSLASMQEKRGLDVDHIMPTMDDVEVFPQEAADVAAQAMRDGVAQHTMLPEEVFQKADHDIKENREMVQMLMERDKIKTPPKSMIDGVLAATIAEIRGEIPAVGGSADE
jgi:malate dehydrogenase (oxaloacetate-decarboxylating)